MRGGREILVDPDPEVSIRDLRLYLLGSAMGVLLHQRGFLPLHANAIVIGGRAIAFAGPSGAGKSTLAAYFEQAGHPVLRDDLCALSFDADGRPMAWPGLRRVKLWRDAIEALDREAAGLEPVLDGMDKFHLRLSGAIGTAPLPLDAVYMLGRSPAGEAGRIEPLAGREAFVALSAEIYRREVLAPMGLAPRVLTQVGALARHAKLFRGTRAWGFDVFASEAARLVGHIRREAAGASRAGSA